MKPSKGPFGKAAIAAIALLFGFVAAYAQPERATLISPQEPRTLLPHFDLLTLTHETQHLIFDCLLTIDAEGNYQPQLATEVPTVENGGISADATLYTFRLREGVQWHDGEPFTAEDVVFTWEVITDPELPVPSRAVWEDIERIETPDPYTALVYFPETNVNFLAAAATGSCFMLPRHLLEGEDIVGSPLNRQPVGTGPFMVSQWASGAFIELDRNPSYWQEGLPHLDEIILQIVPGSEGQRAALQRNEVDLMLHMTSADLRFVADLPSYEVVTGPTHAWWLFWINHEDPILQDAAVRRALAYGLDKETLTETVMGAVVAPLEAALPPSHWAHNPDVTGYPYDPERAQALLDEAGWTVGGDGIRTKDGERLRLEILNIAGQVERRQVIQIVQDYWRQLGIDVQIREIDGPAFPPTMGQGDFQIAYGWFSETQEPVFNLWLGTNWQRYDNEEAFGLLRQVPTVVDQEERAALIRRFQEIVAEDVAILPLAPRPILNAVHERLEGYQPGLAGSLWNAQEWRLR
jgi:peptide/nickel transport system substrate-binding protein